MNTVGVGAGSNLSFYNQVIPDVNATLSLATSINCVDGPCIPSTPSAPFNSPIAMGQLANQLGGAILVGHSESSAVPDYGGASTAGLLSGTVLRGSSRSRRVVSRIYPG